MNYKIRWDFTMNDTKRPSAETCAFDLADLADRHPMLTIIANCNACSGGYTNDT